MQKRRILALLLSALLLAGCSRPPTGAPESPASQPSTTPVTAPAVDPTPVTSDSPPKSGESGGTLGTCVSSIPEQPYGRWDIALGKWLWVTSGICPITTDERSREIEFILPPGVDEAVVRAGLTYSGAGQVATRFVHQDVFTRVYITIPHGPAGEQADLILKGTWGPGGKEVDMGFRLTRVTSARVESDMRLGNGPWEPLKGARLIPPQPLSLRFRLAGGVDAAEFEALLATALGDTDYKLEKPTPGTIIAVLPDPPRMITIEPDRLKSPYGPAEGEAFRLYIGVPPEVVALDPATGQEQVIGTAPPDIWAGSLSPDGRWAMFSTVVPESCYESRVWLMDLTEGTVLETPLRYGYSGTPIAWPSGRLVTASWNQVEIYHLSDGHMETRSVTGRTWTEPSPDGRYLLGYVKHYDRERADWHAPITIAVYDLETGQERTFPDVAWAFVTHSGAPPMTRLYWTPDGTGVLINDPRGKDHLIGGQAVLRLDLETGTTTPYDLPAPDRAPWRPGPDGFSYQEPGWFTDNWGPVHLRSPGGDKREAGEGLVLGWAPDGALILVRWSNEGLPHCEGE